MSLPEPTKTRWQPLRLGLVELFRYDSEEFWFRDGHLLLRGNNGTGKSKVLSLTLPLLLDASLRSSRVEPDGDPGKKMAWNLLLGGSYERRTGYSWIEFGCLGADGQPRYLTLGLGLHAVAARAQQLEAWYFITEATAGQPRLGRDWWLISTKAPVPGREALRQLFNTGQAGAAQVFEQAHGYRRAVDERLFQLGARRYDALLDTLIQLRQPQLSRRPDEKLLSAALTESLPPLPPELLADVADALGQLEELRNELERAQRLLQAVQKFDSRYRSYAGMASRRQARGLRQAQTEFDLASRAHNEGLLRLGQAQLTEQEATQRRANAETLLHGARQRHETLLADPRHADANQLQQASANARHAEDDRVQARQRHETAQRQAEREAGLWQQAQAALQAARLRLQHSRSVLGALALQTGLPPDLHQHRYMAAPEDTLAQPIETKADEAHRRELHAWMEQRREDLRLVRRRITAAEQARDRLLPLRQALAERRADVEDAAAQHAQAEAQQAQHAQAHEEAWAEHLQQLQVLQLPDPQAVLHSLARWTQHAEGEHPGRLALHQAQAEAAAQHAQAQASLAAQKLAAETEGAALASEAQALQAGLQAPPAAPAWRGPGTRPPGLPGAPLWQLVDFAPELPAHHRAGLEAALLGAGLLDAWVTPEGTLQPAQGGAPWLDAQWLARPARHAQALSQWLQPDAAQDSAVPAATVAALLAAVACGAQDEPKAEAWVAPDGRFRLGGLAGRAELAEARHIGHAARAAARQQRLQLIQERQQALALELARLQVLAAQQQARALRAQHEWQHLPEEHTLQRAHHASAAAARALALGRQREAEAEHRCREAEAQAQAALAALLADATDLRLPNETAALESVEQALHHSVAALHELQAAVQNLQMAGPVQAQLQARAAEAQAAVAQAQAHLAEREQWAEAARTRLAAMEAAMGQSVAELQRLLARAQALVQRLQGSDKRLGEVLRGATEARAVAEQQAASAAQRLATAQTQRSQQVQALREFTATGLLASGLAGAAEASVLPDPTQPWGVDTALQLARHTEQVLAGLNDGDEAWKRSQEQVTLDLQELQRALSALNAQASAQPNNFGFVVHLQWQLKARRPDELAGLLQAEVAAQQGLLSAREQAVLENHLQAEIATQVQTLMRGAAQRLAELNAELHQHPTSTGVRFRLLWQPLPEGQGAPAGLHAARERLLQTHAGLWSGEERRAFGALLQQRIDDERRQPDAGSLHEQLTRALDYRQWHQFRVERWQDGQWRKLSGPASSGERALGLTVPLFAAVATFYSASPLAPRLILLDEAFAGIDDAARAHCMDLVRKFDLDFVITSEREWGCYATLPGVAICQLQRREGIDAVHLSRWAWDGTARRADALPGPRLPPAGTATEPELDAQP